MEFEYDYIIVEHKDRLTRFGFNYIDMLLKNANKQIIVINEVKEEKEDLIQDFITINTSFFTRIYGKGRMVKKTEHIIEELNNESKKNYKDMCI